MYAHYFRTGKEHHLIISKSIKPIGATYILPSMKRVRAKAKELNAKPYNF